MRLPNALIAAVVAIATFSSTASSVSTTSLHATTLVALATTGLQSQRCSDCGRSIRFGSRCSSCVAQRARDRTRESQERANQRIREESERARQRLQQERERAEQAARQQAERVRERAEQATKEQAQRARELAEQRMRQEANRAGDRLRQQGNRLNEQIGQQHRRLQESGRDQLNAARDEFRRQLDQRSGQFHDMVNQHRHHSSDSMRRLLDGLDRQRGSATGVNSQWQRLLQSETDRLGMRLQLQWESRDRLAKQFHDQSQRAVRHFRDIGAQHHELRIRDFIASNPTEDAVRAVGVAVAVHREVKQLNRTVINSSVQAIGNIPVSTDSGTHTLEEVARQHIITKYPALRGTDLAEDPVAVTAALIAADHKYFLTEMRIIESGEGRVSVLHALHNAGALDAEETLRLLAIVEACEDLANGNDPLQALDGAVSLVEIANAREGE